MDKPGSLIGTIWCCTDKDFEDYGMTCTVIDGEITSEWNGDNNIEIKYEDGTIANMKQRRFMHRFKQLKKPTKK